MKKYVLIFLLICSIAFAQNKGYKIIRSFSAGELSPLMLTREDLSKYHSGCMAMENMIPLPQGPAMKRPGTKYVADSKEDTAIKLFPFEYSTDQTYIIEAGNQYFRFYTDHAQVAESAGTDDLGTLNNNLVHFKLNEISGNDIYDSSANSHDCVIYDSGDASTYTDDGNVDLALNLDGTTGFYDADNSAFSFTNGSADSTFSIVLWAYITEWYHTQTLVSRWSTDALREWRFSLTDKRKLRLELCDNSGDSSTNAVAQWNMNDEAASTHVDDVTTNHDGVCSVNTDTIDATGILTQALDFGDAEYVTVADDNTLSFDDSGDKPFSISAWVYHAYSSTDTQTILAKYDYGTTLREYKFYIRKGDLYLYLYDESTDGYQYAYTNSAIGSGWQHVVATYGSAGGADAHDDIILYVNGEAVTTVGHGDESYVAMENTDTDLTIGALLNNGSDVYNFHNEIDVVSIFDIELSTEEVKELYNDGAGTEGDVTYTVYAESDDAIDIGWKYLGCTYSAPADESTAADGIILYVDGAAVDSTAHNSSDYTAMQDINTYTRYGYDDSTGSSVNFFRDRLDEISIFTDVLTSAEVLGLYGTSTYEIETPYLTADLPELKYKQSADVLFITHPDYEPRKLIRYADTVWSLEALAVDNGPFLTQNTDTALTITPSATTGTITLTASDDLFKMGATVGHLPSGSTDTSKSQTGALFEIVQPVGTGAYEEVLEDNYTDDQTENTSWMDCGTIAKGACWYLYTLGTWTGTLEVQRNYTIGAAHDNANWETVYTFKSTNDRNVIADGQETEDDADYRCILTTSGDDAEPLSAYFRISDIDHSGVVEIASVTSPTSATATVIKSLASTDPTYRWSEGAWSNYRGWPRTVTFFEDRLVFGGNKSNPDTIWASVSSDYENFLAGANDDDALNFTLSSRQVNVIQWLNGKEKLMIGTSGAEWSMGGEADEGLTPNNRVANQHSNHGSANLQAILAGESILFFQRGAQKMRELAYNWESDSYVAPDMTILSDHITGDGIIDVAFQKIPTSIVWCVREDGQIALFVYERQEIITAWSRLITDGEFESVAIVPGDPEDEVWVSVKRTINESDVRYIEYFSDRDFGTDVDDAYYVDCGVTYDDDATTAITNLGHLIAEEVYILGDGAIQTAKTVDGSGDIAITSASTVQVGLPFTVQLKTTPLSYPAEGSTILGRKKRINEVMSYYYNSGDFYIGPNTTDKELLSITSMDSSDVDTDDRVSFPAGYDRYGYITVYQKSAEPLTLLSLLIEFEVQ